MGEPGPPEIDGGSPAGDDGQPGDGPVPGTSRRWVLLLGVAAVVVVLDQLTKSWAVAELPGRTIDVVWTLRFRLAYNRGASFSLGGDGGWGPVIGVVAILVVLVLLWQSRSMANRLGTVALGLVLGGAVGNLLDRALRGDDGFLQNPVVDFIDVQWWPVFNVADMGVVIGGLLLLVVALLPERA